MSGSFIFEEENQRLTKLLAEREIEIEKLKKENECLTVSVERLWDYIEEHGVKIPMAAR